MGCNQIYAPFFCLLDIIICDVDNFVNNLYKSHKLLNAVANLNNTALSFAERYSSNQSCS